MAGESSQNHLRDVPAQQSLRILDMWDGKRETGHDMQKKRFDLLLRLHM